MSIKFMPVGNCCLYQFGFNRAEVNKLKGEQGYDEVLRQSTTFKRIRNWIFGVHKADAAKAFYWLTHATTAEEAHYHFLRLRQCVGAHANALKYDYSDYNRIFHYSIDRFSDRTPLINCIKWTSSYQLQCPLADDDAQTQTSSDQQKNSSRLPNSSPSIAIIQSASARSPLKELKMSWHWLKFMTERNYKMPGLTHTLKEILDFDDDRLETVHDFIQLLFPNIDPSPYNPKAPLMTDLLTTALKHDVRLQQTVMKCLDKMLQFYGLERDGDKIAIVKGKEDQHSKWKTNINHNHKRLSRIMHCLNALGFAECSDSLKQCLLDNGNGVISEKVTSYWNKIEFNGDHYSKLHFDGLTSLKVQDQ